MSRRKLNIKQVRLFSADLFILIKNISKQKDVSSKKIAFYSKKAHLLNSRTVPIPLGRHEI